MAESDVIQQVGLAVGLLVAFVRVVESVQRDRAQETARLLDLLDKALERGVDAQA